METFGQEHVLAAVCHEEAGAEHPDLEHSAAAPLENAAPHAQLHNNNISSSSSNTFLADDAYQDDSAMLNGSLDDSQHLQGIARALLSTVHSSGSDQVHARKDAHTVRQNCATVCL